LAKTRTLLQDSWRRLVESLIGRGKKRSTCGKLNRKRKEKKYLFEVE